MIWSLPLKLIIIYCATLLKKETVFIEFQAYLEWQYSNTTTLEMVKSKVPKSKIGNIFSSTERLNYEHMNMYIYNMPTREK